jgi:hypothetical protein
MFAKDSNAGRAVRDRQYDLVAELMGNRVGALGSSIKSFCTGCVPLLPFEQSQLVPEQHVHSD